MIVQYIESFLADKQAQRRSPRTIEAYRARLMLFAQWLIEVKGNVPLNRRIIKDYSSHLRNQDLSAATHFSYLNAVLVLVHWLFNEEYIAVFNTRAIKPSVPQRIPAHYSINQIMTLLEHATIREKAIVCVFYDTGVRVSELIQLRRDSFDIRGRATIIGKGNKERHILLSPLAQTVLLAYLDTRTDDSDMLFVSLRAHRPLTANGVHQCISRLAKAAGIRSDIRRILHSFRVTFARELSKANIPIEMLRILLGHESPYMALYYARLANLEVEAHRQKINLMQALESCL